MTNTEIDTARATTPTIRRRATTTGMVLLGIGVLASVPVTAFGALWSLWALADGSLLGAIVMLALAVGNGLACGALFFFGGAIAEVVDYSRQRGGEAKGRLWNWCFAALVILGGLGLGSLVVLIRGVGALSAEQSTVTF
jgi:hypothetical protein